MFTKCQNRKSFIYNKLKDFRESLTYPHNELMRLCLLRWQSERRSAVLRPRWRVGITFSFNPRFLRVRTSDYRPRSPRRPLSATQNNGRNPKPPCPQRVRGFHLGQEFMGWPTP